SETTVVPVLAARDALEHQLGVERQGVEQEVAVLFADLRGFTRMAERRLPYDVVYLLNRYFEVVGSAIARAGGIANQFTGDGAIALFGVGRGRGTGGRGRRGGGGAQWGGPGGLGAGGGGGGGGGGSAGAWSPTWAPPWGGVGATATTPTPPRSGTQSTPPPAWNRPPRTLTASWS